MGVQFLDEEKVHIGLLAVESRKQAVLLYGLSAIAEHLSGRRLSS